MKGGWVRLTKSDSQEEDQGMICRLVYTYTNYERREGKRRGPRRSLGDLLYIVYGGRCRLLEYSQLGLDRVVSTLVESCILDIIT